MIKKLLVFIILIIIFYDIYILFIVDLENTIEDQTQNKEETHDKVNYIRGEFLEKKDLTSELHNDYRLPTSYNQFDTHNLEKVSENKHYKLNEIHEMREKQLINNHKIPETHDIILEKKIPETQHIMREKKLIHNSKLTESPKIEVSDLVVSPLMFGKPSEYVEDKYILSLTVLGKSIPSFTDCIAAIFIYIIYI
jgi:hypothetical protein